MASSCPRARYGAVLRQREGKARTALPVHERDQGGKRPRGWVPSQGHEGLAVRGGALLVRSADALLVRSAGALLDRSQKENRRTLRLSGPRASPAAAPNAPQGAGTGSGSWSGSRTRRAGGRKDGRSGAGSGGAAGGRSRKAWPGPASRVPDQASAPTRRRNVRGTSCGSWEAPARPKTRLCLREEPLTRPERSLF